MNDRTLLPRQVRTAVASFLVLTALAVAAGFARRAGLLDLEASRRVLGVVVGLMAAVTGNFLPKMRPVGSAGRSAAAVASAERASGWMLVLLGAAFVAMFLAAPLGTAERVAPFAAIGGLALISANWLRVALGWLLPSETRAAEAASPAADHVTRRTIAIWLVFAVVYLMMIASLIGLADGPRWARQLSSWAAVGFSIAYGLVYAALGFRRRAR